MSQSHSHSQGHIGPYRLLRELGRGSMGVVYLAEHRGLARKVAIKALLSVEPDEDLLARFRLEAAVASKLQHPGIVSVQDVGQHGGHPYFVMEYCPGEPLGDRLKREGKLTPRDAARLVAEIGRAVGYAHREGVLHRDLKPANVILAEPSGAPRVTDFGLARDRSLQRSLTRTGDVLGTPSYMAPEQLLGRKDVDPRVDVYSLGVILYQCLTAHRPYDAPSIYRLTQAVCAGGCLSPAALAEVPPALERICMSALALDRSDRPVDGIDLADALEGYLAGADKRGTPPPARGVWAVLLGALIVATLGVGGIAWQRSTTPPATPEGAGLPVIEPTPPASLQPAPPPTSPEPTPTPAAPQEAIASMERWLLELFAGADPGGAVGRIGREADALQARFPQDPRLTILSGFARLARGQADPLAEKQRWLAALQESPTPSDVLAALTARLCYELGFHRAASDALRARAERRSLPSDWAVHTTAENHLLAFDPVRDDALAEQLLRRLLERRERLPLGPGDLPLPDRGTILAYRAVARAARGEVEQAASELERAAGTDSNLRRMATLLRRAPRVQAADFIAVSMGVCELLSRLLTADQRGDPAQAATRLSALATQLQDLRRPDQAALALVRGSRAAIRARDGESVLELLERARELDLRDAPDVRCLVSRLLGRALILRDPQRAERLGREAAAPWDQPEGRTPGELADAWLVVARACRELGDEPKAEEALEAAANAGPVDTRELEALRGER